MPEHRLCPVCNVRKLQWSRNPKTGKIYWGRTCERCSTGRRTPEEVFWGYVDEAGPDDCWIWNGPTARGGYGKFMSKPIRLAHRFSYELHIGPIPEGLYVCHHCDTPACVNPKHLFVGTSRDNMLDAKYKGRLYRADTKSESICKFRALGLSWRNVGRLHGLTAETAYSLAHKHCRTREIPFPQAPPLPCSQIPLPQKEPKSRLREGTRAEQAYGLKVGGFSWREISAQLGWADERQVRNQVQNWCRRRGIAWPIQAAN